MAETRGWLCLAAVAVAVGCGACASGSRTDEAPRSATPTVGVVKVARETLDRRLTMSSELVPFQEIDVYAKQAGYVRQLLVDYGSRVTAGQVMAVLEIPELEAQLTQDDATVQNAADRVATANHELTRAKAQHDVAHLQYERLSGVAKSKAGLVAQQEVDDAHGKDLAAESAVEAFQSSYEAAQSASLAAQANRQRDRVLFNYATITAPFAGVVTQRFANLGTLMQAGTNSSTQAIPLVRLSQDDRFRLVIPVPESSVRDIHVGDPVDVRVPALGHTFPGKITRFSVDVQAETRTMHTEVDVPNPDHLLIAGMSAEATLILNRRDAALAIPTQAVAREGEKTSVLVVDAAGAIAERAVTLGVEAADDIEVLSGVNEGDLVVVGDRVGLKPGQVVQSKVVELMHASAEK
ncbi:MAG: efflux RND transporter periplasmic adaptor subunit [Acidobacteriaceae bacterium]|nr:efflux RND transporter periplasmic adaptor subunit [Acidobacteriaceae bacterium]